MAEFPSASRIIQELNELQPFIKSHESRSRRGEVDAADWIMDFANQWELGDVSRKFISSAPRFENFRRHEEELSNIQIDVGHGNDEILFLHGHFDTVAPTDFYGENFGVIQDQSQRNMYRGLGCYDMLSGIASILTALHDLKIATHRRVRAILVFGEENESEGTHSAFDTRQNMFQFDGLKAALSTEITVGGKLADDYHLVVGRPGRIGLEATVYADAMHAGDIEEHHLENLIDERGARVKRALQRIHLLGHPKDTRSIMKPGNIRVGPYKTDETRSLSSASTESMILNVHFTHPEQGLKEIIPLVRNILAESLGDDRFILNATDREMPWTEPWLEELDNAHYPYPHRIQDIANKVTAGKRSGKEVAFRNGSGVADENIISKHGIPIVCIPPRGEHPHSKNETLDINSIIDFQVPVIQAAAKYPGLLTQD